MALTHRRGNKSMLYYRAPQSEFAGGEMGRERLRKSSEREGKEKERDRGVERKPLPVRERESLQKERARGEREERRERGDCQQGERDDCQREGIFRRKENFSLSSLLFLPFSLPLFRSLSLFLFPLIPSIVFLKYTPNPR